MSTFFTACFVGHKIIIKEFYYPKYIENSSVLLDTLIKSTLFIVIFNTE